MINDALPVWITGHRAAKNTLWLLNNRAGDARQCANRGHLQRLQSASGGGCAAGDSFSKIRIVPI
jgi:hypothetical protein